MKLRQISASDAVTRDILGIVENYSPLLTNHIEFYTDHGNSSEGRKEQGKLDIEGRELDNAYNPIVTKPEYFTAGRKFMGKPVRLDVARERMGYDISSEMKNQLRRVAPGIAQKFHQTLINGDTATDSKDFNGLKKLVTTSQIIKGATNGLKIGLGITDTTKTEQQVFLEKLDETIGLCRGISKVIITNGSIIARLNSVAREYINYTIDSFGKRITTYNGIPLINIEEGGYNVMPFDETVGTANKCSSIYVTSFEEAAGLSFLSVPEGFKVYPMQKVSNFYEHMVELIADSALFRDKAVARLSGLKLS